MTRPIHLLKTLPEPFAAVRLGIKRFEYRRDDRGFDVRHALRLQEYDPKRGYTGAELLVFVKYIARGPDYGIPEGFVVMSIEHDVPIA
jgi:hypothetical protein